MKTIISSAVKTIGGLILVALVLITIIKLSPETPNQIQPGTSNFAYPHPVGSSTPARISTPIPYPPPENTNHPTPTPVVTLTPTAKGTMPRPTDWPTEWPWPPVMTRQPLPTRQATIFPTPIFQPRPSGTMPTVLQKLWYVFSPDSARSPIIQAEQIDASAQRWGQSQTTVDLGLDRNFPGPFLSGLFPSPDSRWLAAQLDFGDVTKVYIINLDTGKTTQILPKDAGLAFITWKPDSQKIIINDYQNGPTSVVEVDVSTGVSQHLQFPKLDGDLPELNAIAFSPDGSLMADARSYQPRKGGRSECLLSIGITDVKSQERKTIQEIPAACGAIYMQWSVDAHYLSWIAQKIIPDSKLPASAEQDELWISDRVSGETKSVYLIGVNVSHLISPAWSPDSNKIAFVKSDVNNVRYPDGNIILIDPIHGLEVQASHFSGQSLSSVQWSSDGKWLFCNAFNAQYGTIWAINLEKSTSFPVAGPVAPNSPFTILP